jgi:hypothetical protein
LVALLFTVRSKGVRLRNPAVDSPRIRECLEPLCQSEQGSADRNCPRRARHLAILQGSGMQLIDGQVGDHGGVLHGNMPGPDDPRQPDVPRTVGYEMIAEQRIKCGCGDVPG